MRTWREILLTATAVVAIGAAPAIAQNATVHGKVVNPAGQAVTGLNLRNRPHAIAYAVRNGLL